MKINIKSLFIVTTLSLTAFTASAVPIYTGNTFGAVKNNGTSDNSKRANIGDVSGYYLWNDALSPRSWYLRWSSKGNPSAGLVEWFGLIKFKNNDLNTVDEFQFSKNGSDELERSNKKNEDRIDFKTVTKNGIDGVDFTVSSSYSLMSYKLGSSLFSGQKESNGKKSRNVFIGVNNESPLVNLRIKQEGTFERFAIQEVAAPSALVLMGLGFLGLGLASRKQKTK